MALYLIRHGETRENRARVVQLPGVPLSERGVEQARRLAERLAGEGIVRILASDLRRAAMTAELLAESTGALLDHDPLLQERNFGALRGRSYDEIGFDPDFTDDPPEGESVPVFHERVERAWRRVLQTAEATEGHVAVVTHGLVCQALVERHMVVGADAADAPRRWGNTSVTIAEAGEPWRVRLLNCTAHLGALEGAPVGAPV